MKKALILSTLLLFVNACSHTRPVVVPDNPTHLVMLETDPPAVDGVMPYPLVPIEPVSNASMSVEGSGGGALVMLAGMGIAAGIGAIMKTKEVRKDIQGSCYYGDINSPAMSVPCVRVKVNLLDEEKKVAASIETTAKGEFRFYIPANKSYTVQVTDRKGRSAELEKKVARADFVSVYLKP